MARYYVRPDVDQDEDNEEHGEHEYDAPPDPYDEGPDPYQAEIYSAPRGRR